MQMKTKPSVNAALRAAFSDGCTSDLDKVTASVILVHPGIWSASLRKKVLYFSVSPSNNNAKVLGQFSEIPENDLHDFSRHQYWPEQKVDWITLNCTHGEISNIFSRAFVSIIVLELEGVDNFGSPLHHHHQGKNGWQPSPAATRSVIGSITNLLPRWNRLHPSHYLKENINFIAKLIATLKSNCRPRCAG